MILAHSPDRRCSRRRFIGALAITPLLGSRMSLAADGAPDFASRLSLAGTPGMAWGAVSGGRVLTAGGKGTARVADGFAPDADTVFEVGSLTKTFTASLIFQLEEEGKLRIDAPVDTYVKHLPDRWRNLTLSQFLSHTSGLPEYLDQTNFRRLMPLDLTPRDIVAMAANLPLRFGAGVRHEYNNLGFILLGMTAEAVSGKPYWDELQRRFFTPAGMASTGPRNRLSHATRYASGHFWDGNRYDDDPPRSAPGSTWSAGGLLSTAADMNRWSLALDSGRILSMDVRRRMWTQARLANGAPAGWGYGWQIETIEGRTIASHGGGTAGFSCWYRRDVSRPLSTIVLTNQNGRADPKTMTDALLKALATTRLVK